MSIMWIVMVVGSILVLCFSAPGKIVSVMISASQNAITLCLELMAIYAVWLGILHIMEETRLTNLLAKGLSKPIDFCFGAVSMEAKKNISLNVASNLLGLGGAATPYGIKAMQNLDTGKLRANGAMIMLVVINSTGIQLLPTTVIGLRAMAGSIAPSNIILPSRIVTIIPTIIGVALVKSIYFSKKRNKT